MTDREQAAFTAGIHHAADMALVVAATIESRPGADHVRQRAAVTALQALSEGLKEVGGVEVVEPTSTRQEGGAAALPSDLRRGESKPGNSRFEGLDAPRTRALDSPNLGCLNGDIARSPDLASPRSAGRPGIAPIPAQPVASREGDVETSPIAGREYALTSGYVGDPCPTCANFTLRRAGTCLACDTCGSTTGCS